MKWILLLLVVLFALFMLAMLARRNQARQEESRRLRATELRDQAAATASAVKNSELDAREAQLEAERLRAQAEAAEQRATEASRAHDMDRADLENTLREADRLDPEVDHRSPDYSPTEPDTILDDAPDLSARGTYERQRAAEADHAVDPTTEPATDPHEDPKP